MLILAIGMPRAGSGWHYNLTHDLVVANGGRDARQIRRQYLLSPILTEVNCNIGALTAKRLIPTMIPALMGNTYVIKAHAGPKPLARRLIENGRIRATYIYRDPRAALLSAYEYGQRGLADRHANAFSHLTTMEKAIEFMAEYVRISEEWLALPAVLAVRFETLLQSYDSEVRRLAAFLAIDLELPNVKAAMEKYRPGQTTKQDRGLHFHKGETERFRSILTAEHLKLCNGAFGDYLQKMGYVA